VLWARKIAAAWMQRANDAEAGEAKQICNLMKTGFFED